MTALAIISREFPVDANRTFLVGSGKGFAAVEATAAAFPHIFAGVVGIGDVAALDANNLGNFRNLPTLFSRETEGTKAIKAKIDELGFGNCTITGKPADDGTRTDGTPADTWAWIGKTVRTAYPRQISFAPKSDYARRAHWLSLEGARAQENPRVEAKADKATNTITITVEKVADLVVYLNDELVDLDKPVKFVVNGTTHERMVERSAPEMIKNQYFGGDWGRVFTASVAQDVK
jgi:hypothetical protein